MAGEDLFASLYSSRYAPIDTGWGLAAQGVSAGLPGLVNPYGNPFSNFATVLGGALVSGLLGYQARQQSDERNVLQSALLTEALKPDLTGERRKEILGLDPRLSRVLTNVDLSRAMADIETQKTRASEEAKARVEVQKQIDIERGVPYGTTKASELMTPTGTTATGAPAFMGKQAETEIEKIQKTFSTRPEFKNYSYTTDVLKRLSQGVMKTDAVSDVDFAKGAIQAIEPGLATQQGEVDAITLSPSLPEQIRSSLGNAIEGKGKLTPKTRAQILSIVEGAYKAQSETYNQQYDFYKNEAIAKTKRPDLADDIERRISDLGRPKPYEQVVNQWFKIPGYDLGDLDADKVIKALANDQITPDLLYRSLEQQKQPGAVAQRAGQAIGKSTAPVSPAFPTVAPSEVSPGESAQVVVAPTATPGAALARAIGPTDATVQGPQAGAVTPVMALKPPTADALQESQNKVTAAAELRALDKKGTGNWTIDDRVRALQLKAILKG